ncbi:DUF3592 domain-containing protein [Myroides fluvii]|uniref:DUF3592 domain-containing protein n=1 Tax=Myroides fluvii TaxID=2572594 RepID=UPI00131BC29C|nr:DUF3592 domain-containing protein [Myroides fluvii]
MKKILSWIFLLAFVFFMFYNPIFCGLQLGALCVYYVVHYATFLNHINKHGKESRGTILSYETEGKGHKTPLVEFEINGEQIVKKPYYYASTDLSILKTYKNKINKSISILYDPRCPEKFIIKSEKGFNYFSLIFAGLVGLLFVLISLVQLYKSISLDGME